MYDTCVYSHGVGGSGVFQKGAGAIHLVVRLGGVISGCSDREVRVRYDCFAEFSCENCGNLQEWCDVDFLDDLGVPDIPWNLENRSQ